MRDFLVHGVNELSVECLYLQQDGATCHTAREQWPFCVNVSWINHIDQIKTTRFCFVKLSEKQGVHQSIRQNIAHISIETLRHVMESAKKRAEAYITVRDGYLPGIIFHKLKQKFTEYFKLHLCKVSYKLPISSKIASTCRVCGTKWTVRVSRWHICNFQKFKLTIQNRIYEDWTYYYIPLNSLLEYSYSNPPLILRTFLMKK